MSSADKKSLSEAIKNKSTELGFFSCGISEATSLGEDAIRLRKWLKLGYHSGMAYMANHFEKRTDPRKLVENAKSVISVLYNYAPGKNIPQNDNYKISTYAYGIDYHHILKKKLKLLIRFLQQETGESDARAFVDSAPVLDRAWAARSGLGWIGKNTMLITKEQGSFFFIGEIITDIELEPDDQKVANHCGGCTRCIDACPTGALGPYVLNANKCISYLTIENREETIPDEFKDKFQDWIFGCDICQQVCPWNRLSEPHHEPEFNPSGELLEMRKTDWENMTEAEFRERFKSSPIKRAKYKGLERNIQFVKSR